jgi:hypothetical protein
VDVRVDEGRSEDVPSRCRRLDPGDDAVDDADSDALAAPEPAFDGEAV